ncbi:MAG TPA: winged helix-turn-helix domain-containing protein [Granulicella sp.]|jgi:DNA-binding winged helix-turn-helix (wHTH) protein|nr:winged helix-turn-helix domain-containing protein [Granulicella sp.]
MFRFGPYQLDLSRHELRNQDRRQRLPASLMRLLGLFVSRAGVLITREEIAQRLWTDPQNIDISNGINTAINRLRTELGDDPASPIYIETVIGIGYRFVAPVDEIGAPVEEQSIASTTDLPMERTERVDVSPTIEAVGHRLPLWAILLAIATLTIAISMGAVIVLRNHPGPSSPATHANGHTQRDRVSLLHLPRGDRRPRRDTRQEAVHLLRT